MHTYTVKIFRDGQHVDTQTVQVSDKEIARDSSSRIENNSIKTKAMLQCRVPMRGAEVTYEITEVR